MLARALRQGPSGQAMEASGAKSAESDSEVCFFFSGLFLFAGAAAAASSSPRPFL